MSDPPFRLVEGTTPLLVSMPHVGLYIPPDIETGMTAASDPRADTDWHIDRLYDFAAGLGASTIAATHSRYVIDLNRRPDGAVLYAGADNTELCPTSTFDRLPLYPDGGMPDDSEVARRIAAYWRPYHDHVTAELHRLKTRFGHALLFDAHSIRSQVPRFFDGRLPDLNLGTRDGTTAEPTLVEALETTLVRTAGPCGYTWIRDGRFKGGYITAQYGRPEESVQAVQMELSQITYMDEGPPFAFREDLATGIRPVLKALLETMLAWEPAQ